MSEQSVKKDTFVKKYFFIIIGMPIVFWALAFPLIKIGLEELSPVNLTIMRLLVVCIVFVSLLLVKPKKFSKLQKRVYHLGLNYGEQYVSASASSVIIATIPIFVVILASIFLKEKITLKIVLGVILSILGVVIIYTVGRPNALLEVKYISGALTILLAAVMAAGYTVAGKKMLQRYSALSLTVYVCLLGSLGLIPFISSTLFEEVAAMSLNGWGVVIFLGLFPTVVGYVLWFVALEIKNASEISVFLYFVPVLSTIISYILFREAITWLFIFGGTLVILGLYVVNKQSSKVN